MDVIDFTGAGTKDLFLSARNANYANPWRQIGTYLDGDPILGAESRIDWMSGHVTAVPDGGVFHLISIFLMRKNAHFYRNIGRKRAPEFADSVNLELDADWVKGNE